MPKPKTKIIHPVKKQAVALDIVDDAYLLGLLDQNAVRYFIMSDKGWLLGDDSNGGVFWMGKRFRSVLDAKIFDTERAAQQMVEDINNIKGVSTPTRAFIFSFTVSEAPKLVGEINCTESAAEKILSGLSSKDRALLTAYYKMGT